MKIQNKWIGVGIFQDRGSLALEEKKAQNERIFSLAIKLSRNIEHLDKCVYSFWSRLQITTRKTSNKRCSAQMTQLIFCLLYAAQQLIVKFFMSYVFVRSTIKFFASSPCTQTKCGVIIVGKQKW